MNVQPPAHGRYGARPSSPRRAGGCPALRVPPLRGTPVTRADVVLPHRVPLRGTGLRAAPLTSLTPLPLTRPASLTPPGPTAPRAGGAVGVCGPRPDVLTRFLRGVPGVVHGGVRPASGHDLAPGVGEQRHDPQARQCQQAHNERREALPRPHLGHPSGARLPGGGQADQGGASAQHHRGRRGRGPGLAQPHLTQAGAVTPGHHHGRDQHDEGQGRPPRPHGRGGQGTQDRQGGHRPGHHTGG